MISPEIDYADVTPEQQRIIDAGQTVAGTFPEGLSKTELSAWIMDLMLKTAMDRLMAEGKSKAEAREIAEHILSAPSPFVIPTIEELDSYAPC